MSIHLESMPIPFGMDPKQYLINLAGPGVKVATVNTMVTDYDVMEDIIANTTVGFKSKRSLMEFQDRCIMYFEYDDSVVNITFIGHYNINEITMFVNGLNDEFFNRLENRIQRLKDDVEEIKNSEEKIQNKTRNNDSDVNDVKKDLISKKENKNKESELGTVNVEEKNISFENSISENKFIISSNLKDKSIIDKILNECFLGYSSKEELDKFQNIGKIKLKKSLNGTIDFLFIGDYDEEEAKIYVQNLTDEYALIVQEQTYLKVLEKVKKEKLSLESEIIDNEDSIVLTLRI